jgi:hypothetical protein
MANEKQRLFQRKTDGRESLVLYLVFKVFVSDERLGARHRNMACAAAIIVLIILGGCYALIRPFLGPNPTLAIPAAK